MYTCRGRFLNEKTGNVTNLERAGSITVGDNCRLGGGVTVCANVTIGEGSVVTRDVPANSLAAGVPCRVIRSITGADSVYTHPEWIET